MFSKYETRLKQLENNDKVKARDKKYVNLELKLKYYEEEYAELMETPNLSLVERVSIMFRFCRKASYLLHEVRNKSNKTMKSLKTAEARKTRMEAEKSNIWKSDLHYQSFVNNVETPEALQQIIEKLDVEMVENEEVGDDFDDLWEIAEKKEEPENEVEVISSKKGNDRFHGWQYNPPDRDWCEVSSFLLDLNFEKFVFKTSNFVNKLADKTIETKLTARRRSLRLQIS